MQAHLRRCEAAGSFATIARRGDPDAGAVAVKVFLGGRSARLYIESRDLDGAPIWREPLGDERAEPAIDQWLAREINIDPDLWIVEIEDREGRAFFDDPG